MCSITDLFTQVNFFPWIVCNKCCALIFQIERVKENWKQKSVQLIWKFEVECKQKINDASTLFGQREFKNGMIKFYVVMHIMGKSWHWYTHKSYIMHICYLILSYNIDALFWLSMIGTCLLPWWCMIGAHYYLPLSMYLL